MSIPSIPIKLDLNEYDFKHPCSFYETLNDHIIKTNTVTHYPDVLNDTTKKITNFEGKIFYNNKYPDGVLKRNLSNKILKKYGWKPKIKLQSKEGLEAYYEYFKRV